MKQLTEIQFNSLTEKIWDSLISNDNYGLGEMGSCTDEAERIVKEWAEENQILIPHLND